MPATVLVIEDEPAIQELIAYNLKQAGHQALRADNAEQAIRLVQDALPDLVLLDWMLPGLSGIELARRLRAGPCRRAGQVDGVGYRRGRLHHQAILAARVERPSQGAIAAALAADDGRHGAGGLAQARPFNA
jgi:CheY-like chemotaxis protein